MESTTYETLVKDMQEHAELENPKECCGLITTDFEYVPCENLSPQPEDFFVLDPLALVEHIDDCWGIFHSHPGQDNPLPSENDIASTSFEEYNFLVGWKEKFYIYWYDRNVEALRFEKLTKDHLCKT